MNWRAILAIYKQEMERSVRTVFQSLMSPILSTSLYFIVFGAVIGERIQEIDGIEYKAFILPGLIMMTLLTQSISNASFGIYFPRFTGAFYEILSAPVSTTEITIGYVGAAVSKSVILGFVILITASVFVPIEIQHPIMMVLILILTSLTFSLFGFIIGIWADGFEKLQIAPMLVITPLAFLGGSFYSIDILPPAGRMISLFNPIVYLISAFRWSFYGRSDVNITISFIAMALFIPLSFAMIYWIFKSGYKVRE